MVRAGRSCSPRKRKGRARTASTRASLAERESRLERSRTRRWVPKGTPSFRDSLDAGDFGSSRDCAVLSQETVGVGGGGGETRGSARFMAEAGRGTACAIACGGGASARRAGG